MSHDARGSLRHEDDKTLNLTAEQKREVDRNPSKEVDSLQDAVRRLYRLLYVPVRDGVKETDMGIPTYGERKTLDTEAYEKLRQEGELLEKIALLVLKEKYLKERNHVKLSQIYDSMLKTPGERRIVSPAVIEESVKQTVKQRFFGLGELMEDGTVNCRFDSAVTQ